MAALGLTTTVESVYRLLLKYPHAGVPDIAERLAIPEDHVRDCFNRLIALALLRESTGTPGGFHVVDPAVELLDLDAAHDRLQRLTQEIEAEVLTFMPGDDQSASALALARRNDTYLLERNVRMRTIGLESIRDDPAMLARARFLTDGGAEFRLSAALPSRMVLVDRRAALVAIDPDDTRKGTLYVTESGIIASMVALFEQVWRTATPLGAATDPRREGLNPRERALLTLLGAGLTDEAAAGRLGISYRTARRMMSGMMERLNARSRFEAGLKAAQRGWL